MTHQIYTRSESSYFGGKGGAATSLPPLGAPLARMITAEKITSLIALQL